VYYFRFEIPENEDGTPVSFSPNWHGTMPKCPKKVTVLMYNTKERYGIARADDTFTPPEVEKRTEIVALKEVDDTVEIEGVWKGENIEHIWDEEELDGR